MTARVLPARRIVMRDSGRLVLCCAGRERVRVALAFRATLGSSGAPAILLAASAWMMRATAAAMSKFEVYASWIRSVSSFDRKSRHQSSLGGALVGARGASL